MAKNPKKSQTLSEAQDLALPMEVADGEGIQSEILRFAQNDSACIFLPFADFFTPSLAWALLVRPFGAQAG
jgi:hypothetical protein